MNIKCNYNTHGLKKHVYKHHNIKNMIERDFIKQKLNWHLTNMWFYFLRFNYNELSQIYRLFKSKVQFHNFDFKLC